MRDHEKMLKSVTALCNTLQAKQRNALEEIDRLRAERDEAMRLLEPFAKAADIIEEGDYHWADNQHITKGITMGSLRKARAAIGKGK